MNTKLFTCLNCHIAFEQPEAQRAHYKTDWHRYNLRRKAADLPPVNQESFHARSGAVDAKHAATEASQIKDPKYCASCKKGYSCEKTFAQHLLSKKHLEAVSEAGGCANHPKCPSKAPRDKDLVMQVPQNASPQEIEEIIAYNLKHSRRLALEECLFCECAPFPSLSHALEHMATVHSFCIPDLDYLVDLSGLIGCLGEKISVFNTCIYCGDKSRLFRGIEAVRKHMIDKGHCRMNASLLSVEDEEGEFSSFYDYYASDEEQEEGAMITSNHTAPPSYTIAEDESELILPSGMTIGNRAYKVYYKQYLPVQYEHESFAIKRLNEAYKALGVAGAGDRELRVCKRRQVQDGAKYAMDMGVRHSGLQKHFRAQIL